MMPSDMNLRIRDSVAGYNNKILISKKGFSVGKNQKVNNKNNLIVMDKAAVVDTPTVAAVVNKTSMVDNKAGVVATPTSVVDTLTVEEEETVAVGVVLALVAAIWMIYK